MSSESTDSDDLTHRRRRKSLDRLKKESEEIDKKPYHPSPPMDDEMIENPRQKKKKTL